MTGSLSVETVVLLREILSAGIVTPGAQVAFTGAGALPSAYAVTDLAAASIAAASLAAADIATLIDAGRRDIAVDTRLASLWFSTSTYPQGWTAPPVWDPLSRNFRTRDGWIRLHGNAPHHRAAALAVIGEDDNAETAIAQWRGADLEAAIVAAGGCAAVMMSEDAWRASDEGRAVAAEPLIAWSQHSGGKPPHLGRDAARPLAGIRVLDLTRVIAGPVATRFLAGLGAEVLRIDPPEWDEPALLPDMLAGKRTARLDMRTENGRTTLAALLARADILVHGYRSDALERLGFGREERRRLAPGLIDIALDAYGWTGPWRARRGFDSLVQMSTGIADTGMRVYQADIPTPLPVQALDHATGYMLAFAALQGLADAVRGGGATSARLSLARTAHLLMAHGVADDRPPIMPVADDDLDPAIEETDWGPVRRLRPAADIEGVTQRYDRPARRLGADAPTWTT